MFPGQNDQFGSDSGADGNLGFGGSGSGGIGSGSGNVGGPPPADAMFESFFEDGLDDLVSAETAIEPRENEVFAVGLRFFKHMRAM